MTPLERIALQAIDQFRSHQRLRLIQHRPAGGHGQHHAADVIFADRFEQFEPVRVAVVHRLRLGEDHDQLPDLLLRRHLVQHLVGPFLAVSIEVDGTWLLEMLPVPRFGEAQRGAEQKRTQQKMSEHVVNDNKIPGPMG